MEDENVVRLKLKINELIFENSPDQTTLREAEDAAIDILKIILNANDREVSK